MYLSHRVLLFGTDAESSGHTRLVILAAIMLNKLVMRANSCEDDAVAAIPIMQITNAYSTKS